MADPDLAKERYLALQRTARSTGRPSDELMSIYALEGFLARLGKSTYASKLVLKGGMLLAVFTERRPTRDIDLQAVELANNADTIRSIAVEVASLDHSDGVEYDSSTSSAEIIREDDDYSGVRVSMDAQLYRARLRLKLDVNVGDPVWPDPIEIEVPSILDDVPSIRVFGYPLSMVFAEKLVTAVARGVASTRWRDFADMVLLSSSNEVEGDELQGALDTVATYRQVQLVSLREVLDGYATLAQDRWRTWLERQGLENRVSPDFAEVLESVFLFSDPALNGLVEDAVWKPGLGWTRPS
ncbi:MAG: nucleotidyl transferase AbiEii/AbiGii toxin family protein [Acidimicrobiia bacterium]|nr:MAG: nucleotidyl transferase AbiEii/AbiGii toxin family protein [Acidimicrobiia bacterium]